MEKENKDTIKIIRETSKSISCYCDSVFSKTLPVRLHGIECMTIKFLIDNKEKTLSPIDVATRFHITNATTSSTLHRLEKKGLIELVPSENDHRKKNIAITKKGLAGHDEFAQVAKEVLKTIEKDFTEEEKENLIVLLDKIQKNIRDSK